VYDIVKSLTVAVIIYRYPLFKCTQTRYGINSGRQSRSWPRRSLIVNMHDTGSWSHARRKLFSLSPVQYFTQCVISHYFVTVEPSLVITALKLAFLEAIYCAKRKKYNWMCPHAWRLPFSLTTELGVVNLTDYPCFRFGYDRTKILNDSVYKT